MRKTGPSKRQAELVVARADGVCEVCGYAEAQQLHHRKPRGMGGSKDPAINEPSNLIHICQQCHSSIESKRTQSEANGHIVRRYNEPVTTPLLRRGTWVLLNDEGGWMPIDRGS